jgi:ABC-type Na+ efflux pump permease subunit
MVAYLLLIAFILTPVFWFPNTDPIELLTGPGRTLQPKEAAELGQSFGLALLEAVLFAVAAMTPGYTAIAIADEKERQTLPLLLTTCLSDREIVLGKAAGRFVFVLIAALAALPVLFATMFLGGVEMRILLVGVGLIAGTAVLATAIGVDAAATTNDIRSALVRAYGVTAFVVGTGVIPPFVFVSPFGVLIWFGTGRVSWGAALLVGVAYPLLQFLIAIGFFASAVRRLRRPDEHTRPDPRPRLSVVEAPKRIEPESVSADDDEIRKAAPEPRRTGELPPINDGNPLLWKERYVNNQRTQANQTARVLPFLFASLALLLLAIGAGNLIARFWEDKHDEDEGGRLVMTGGTILAGVYLFPAAIALASCIARERRRNTLESLLAIPLDRRSVLRTKVRAAVERGWWWAPVSLLATGVAFGADGGWRLGLLAGGLMLAGATFTIGLGAYLTVRSVSEVRAFRFLVPAVVFVVGAPVALWNATDWTTPFLSELAMGPGATVFAIAGALLWRRAGGALDQMV